MSKLRLSREQYIKYSRQLMLPEVMLEGQEKLLKARVLLVGMGALGSPQALYLAGAGVGHIGMVDADEVDLTNLQRQIAHTADRVGRLKVDSGADAVAALNPDVQVHKHATRLDASNAMELLADYDVIIDCTDNFPTRYLLNDACVFLGKPLVHGGVLRFEGQTTVFHAAGGGPCYRCLFPVSPGPDAAPSCAEAGVIGVVPGVIGLIQATEVLKLILGRGESLVGRLLLFDALDMSFRELRIKPNPACPVCGVKPSIKALQDDEPFCGITPVQPPQVDAGGRAEEITVVELARKLEAGTSVTLVDVREDWERPIYPLPDAVALPFSTLRAGWRSIEALRQQEIVVCCLFGWRSREAGRFLTQQGFEKVKSLQGGLEYWFVHHEQAGT